MASGNLTDQSPEKPRTGRRLDSWKEIASYLNRGIRTVRRWELEEGLPARRHQHTRQGTVYAYTEEIDAWFDSRRRRLEQEREPRRDALDGGNDATIESDEVRYPTSRWRNRLIAVAVAAAVTVAAFLLLRPSRVMLVVLPLENLSGDETQDLVAEGLTEDLISELGRLKPSAVGVIARASSMSYRGTQRSIDQIARELGVKYAIEGSYGRDRISVRLIETRTQSQVWVQHYGREHNDIVALPHGVAAGVRDALKLGVPVPSRPASASRHSTNVGAYRHYLQGRDHLRGHAAESLSEARAHFQAAVDLDPGYALAHVGLSESYGLLGSYHVIPMDESRAKARAAATKALEIDAALGEAHNALASITSDYYWEWGEVEHHFTSAIELSPNYATARHWYSLHLAFTGRFAEAIAEAHRALELDPVSAPINANLGWIHFLARQYDEAGRALVRTLELAPRDPNAHIMLGFVYVQKGLPQKAVELLQQARNFDDTRSDTIAVHAYSLARAGREAEARLTLEELNLRLQGDKRVPFLVALVYLGLDDHDHALELLEEALDARSWHMAMLGVDPAWDSVRATARFQSILDGVGLMPSLKH
jgi:TolB-like protein/tetratricopeptide (TPR) repeat protein